MSLSKILVFLCFIFVSANTALADSVSAEKMAQQYAEICGEKSCEFIVKQMHEFAKYGDPEAQAILSLLYTNGIGTEIDKERSVKYIKKAANNGFAYAEYTLGMLYRKEQIVGKFGKDADYWIKRAAKGNYQPALDLLASEERMAKGIVGKVQQEIVVPTFDENTEVIVVNADKVSLTDIYLRMKTKGYGRLNQTGSRIKGGGCGNGPSACGIWDIHTPEGQAQWILFTLKINR
jgi:hypothetical protein